MPSQTNTECRAAQLWSQIDSEADNGDAQARILSLTLLHCRSTISSVPLHVSDFGVAPPSLHDLCYLLSTVSALLTTVEIPEQGRGSMQRFVDPGVYTNNRQFRMLCLQVVRS
jgi:hypothetical protein